MRILVLGGTGLLGASLCPQLISSGHDVVVHGYKSTSSDITCDISRYENLESLVKDVDPQIIINLIAYTDVDGCEKDPIMAYRLNAEVPHWISRISRTNDVRFLHISTDHIYDNNNLSAASNEKQVSIRNMYAATKLLGDYYAVESNSVILRTNFFGNSDHPLRKTFSDWIIHSLQEKTQINLFSDVYFNPLTLETLSNTINRIILENYWKKGIYNLGSEDGLSKFEFGMQLADLLNLNKNLIKPVEVDKTLQVKRPKGMIMETDNFSMSYNIKLPSLSDEIKLLNKFS